MSTIRNDISSQSSQRSSDGAERLEALANARQRLQSEQVSQAKSSEAARGLLNQSAKTRVAELLGANTRLSIERANNLDVFVYRAIDTNTGEILNEWPPEQFAKFVSSAISQDRQENDVGQLIDTGL